MNQKEFEIIKERPSFCGFPSEKLNAEKLKIVMRSNIQLCVLNSYRKIMMSLYSVYKFKVLQFESDDKFLIPEFIEKRFQQIPINIKQLQNQQIQSLTFKLNVKNKMQEPMILYTDHIQLEQNNVLQSITQGLQITDTYNIFKLQEGCYVSIQLGLIKQSPESDDKFRGCFVSIFEDESDSAINNHKFESERDESYISIYTYGGIEKVDFQQLFCTQYIEKILNADILIRVDKTQTTIVFNNIPLFIVDAILCLHKDYFFQYFQQVMPTVTNDYQSCLIMKAKQNSQEQSQQQLQIQINIVIKKFIDLMRQLEQNIVEALC